ncbi:DUF5381 family protein [Bacillus sp. FJAT-47783]|uniref:DUF5381 family protein n=1 Tax=Bacillus sp. FJAT-47783 TaxID=2922712 RepID=UPI001FAD2B24|nr:DUF5381 family protein [Bacillus sp. FJAT-47783]
MANIKTEGEIIKVKGSKFMYGWSALFNLGGIGSCIFILFNGLKFESNYSLLYIGGGLFLFPIFIYLTLWHLPGFKPGKVLFTIVPGEEGKIVTKKHTVPIKQIREIDLIRNPFNLMMEVVIKTYHNKAIKIKTYNILPQVRFFDTVDLYVFPYMCKEARKAWNKKITENELLRDLNHERKQKNID